MPEQRTGLTIGNLVALASLVFMAAVAMAGAVGTWYVMQDNQSDMEKAIDEMKETNKRQWQRISEHTH